MQQISQLTKDIKEVVRAIEGKWERATSKDAVWVINGKIAFVEGNKSAFPFSVIQWHQVGSLFIGILGDPGEKPEEQEEKDLAWVIEQLEALQEQVNTNEDRLTDVEKQLDSLELKGLDMSVSGDTVKFFKVG